MRTWLGLFVAIALISAACGGDSESDPDDAGAAGGSNGGGTTSAESSATAASGDDSASDSPDDGDTSEDGDASEDGGTPTPIGPVAENTIQIGDQTWSRTLPMTSGQCVVFEDNGTLPDSAIVWGTLDGDDDIRFSANQRQDGTFQSEVQGDDFFWIAGPRSPGVDDLQIELDFEELTVVGAGTYTSILGDVRAGSFHFKCLPEDQ